MFVHIFRYRLKCLVRNKEQLFWTLLFPLLLATLFHFAFSNIMGGGNPFSPIPVAVVESGTEQVDSAFLQVLDSLSEPGEHQVLLITGASAEEAGKLLEQGRVDGIIMVGASPSLIVRQSDLNQSILKIILDEYTQTSASVARILANNPAGATGLFANLQTKYSNAEETSFSAAPPNTLLNYFYALIAMTCIYGSFWGMRNTTDVQADLSDKGARRSVSPTHKLHVILYEALAAVTVSLGEVLVLLAYLAFVLGISFGDQTSYILLTCLIGCIAGVSFGTCVGTLFRKNERVKSAILVAITMTFSFLAGLMHDSIRYSVARKFPLLSYINPVALITDAFYSLYIFDSNHRFFLNIGLLGLLSVVFCTVSFLRLRGEKYASL